MRGKIYFVDLDKCFTKIMECFEQGQIDLTIMDRVVPSLNNIIIKSGTIM